ncbi:MAG: hypothetical protein ACRD9L_11355, partial [Bryobacteraceae bacterium]
NYALGNSVNAADVTVSVGKRKVAAVDLLSPDSRAPLQSIAFKQEGDRVHFRMPPLEAYEIAVMRFAR